MKLYENCPKITGPSPVPAKIIPLTYNFFPGKYLLHWLTGIIKVIPMISPKRIPKSPRNPQIWVIKEAMNTVAENKTVKTHITIIGCINSIR